MTRKKATTASEGNDAPVAGKTTLKPDSGDPAVEKATTASEGNDAPVAGKTTLPPDSGAPAVASYRAVHTVHHDGDLYEAGDAVTMDPVQAAPLLTLGVLVPDDDTDDNQE